MEEAVETIQSENTEDINLQLQRINESITKLTKARDETTEQLLEHDKTIEEIRAWTQEQRKQIEAFCEVREQLKNSLGLLSNRETELQRQKQIKINEDIANIQLDKQKEQEEAMLRQQKLEQEWLERKLQLQTELNERGTPQLSSTNTRPTNTAVKLQKYTITPFRGEYMDWLRFWNQFTVEVDNSNIAEISKFNYLMELVREEPREDILGLPHTDDGYEEAKRILCEKYGKDIKVHKALIKELEGLQPIHNVHQLNNIHSFYNKLSRVVRTLRTMGKLDTAQSAVYSISDKLGPIKELITQNDDDWEDWNLEDLVENLRKYTNRNPLKIGEENRDRPYKGNKEHYLRRDNAASGSQITKLMINKQKYACTYCDSAEHTSGKCTKILDVAARKEILRKKKACYNCTATGHHGSQCRSRGCFNCGEKHHTSICSKQPNATMTQESNTEKGMSNTNGETGVLHPSITATIEKEPVRIMIDTGASSSYICTEVITKLNLKPIRREHRNIEQMYGTVRKIVEIYKVTLQSQIDNGFSVEIECINAEKDVLTTLPNPNIKGLKERLPRLRRLSFTEESNKGRNVPIHIILGVGDYQQIRTSEPLIFGSQPETDPVAEFTKLGWTLLGGKNCTNVTQKQFLLTTGQEEFERLCSLDVLGITGNQENTNEFSHENFKDHIRYSSNNNKDGYYETRLPWKQDCAPLPENKQQTRARLNFVTKKLEKMNKLQDYDDIMQEQIANGILETVPSEPTGETVHYVPHQPVIREAAESTKLRIVYDCSATPTAKEPSLNECLETGPSLQPKLFDIILRNRFRRFVITGDVQKAFLQIRVDPRDRDAQRILWYDNLPEKNIQEYRFTRVIFGATSSPYILGATLQKHLEKYRDDYPTTTAALLADTYVDDIQGGGVEEKDAEVFKSEATEILAKGGFRLHKWHSNLQRLEAGEGTDKQSITNEQNRKTKILGIQWDKRNDQLEIKLDECFQSYKQLTKRGMVSTINSVYDILGWASPIVIVAKLLFSQVCKLKLSWDEEVPKNIADKWKAWIRSSTIDQPIRVPRAVITRRNHKIELHGFSDASKVAVCATIYVVEYRQGEPTLQNLLVAKSRVSPTDTSIPRLELVAAQMLAKLSTNVMAALSELDTFTCYYWTDSTTVLHWMANKGTWSVFVRNRVNKIKELSAGSWNYVPTKQNPSDLGTRGIKASQLGDLWFKGPSWLARQEDWPDQPEVVEEAEAQTERIRTKLMVTKEDDGNKADVTEFMNSLLSRYNYSKLMRITAYVLRFVAKCRGIKEQGPLNSAEYRRAENTWIKITQQNVSIDCDLMKQEHDDGIWYVNGRIADYQPILLPKQGLFVERLVEHYHKQTLHGGVQSTMNKIRQRFWIPRLRNLVKKIVHRCDHCKRYRKRPLSAPATAILPAFRTELTEPFAATGVDFAGPFMFKTEHKETRKAYIAIFTCAATRAVHLKLCKDQSAEEFQHVLKEFVARRGTPNLIVSDNAKTFQSTSKWIRTLQTDEQLFNYLNSHQIEWKFNLSRAPWWGGFFERLVGIMKTSLSKSVGRALLNYNELEDTLLDVECFMNNRPLCYIGEEFDRPVLTPNILLRGTPTRFLEEDLDKINDFGEVTKRVKYLKTCREQLRKRWLSEYLRALEERHRRISGTDQALPTVGSVVLLADNVAIKPKWTLGRIVDIVRGRDHVIRGFKIKNVNGYICERPIQMVKDLEIHPTELDQNKTGDSEKKGSSEPKEARPSRRAKTYANDKIAGLAFNDEEEQD